MDLRRTEEGLSQRLAGPVPRPAQVPPKPIEGPAAVARDSVEISPQARGAQQIADWAETVRRMPAVREDVLRDAEALLQRGALSSRTSCWSAARNLLHGKVL